MEELILKHALLNAIEHKGKARADSVLKRVIAENPELRKDVRRIISEIEKCVERVNSMSLEEQINAAKNLGIEIKREREIEERRLPDLPEAEEGKVVMRLAPYPSGPLHIGNARMVILNDEYVKKYKGKLLLVMDDTIGSEEKFVLPEAYGLIIDGLKWLNVEFHELIYKSDRLELFYDFAEKLIKENLAYVCECKPEILRKNRRDGKECEHRNQSIEENLEKWKKMLSGFYKEGGAVLRLKTDMKHPNPAFRDRVLMRIVEREHPRKGKKYRVWPLLEFSWAYDDIALGITHILRGKDLIIEDMVEEFIWDKLKIEKKPKFIHYGLLSLEEAKLSKTEARKAIERGEYSGWDDPRTWSLQSLMKRGIQPEAVRKFVLNMGLSLADVSVPAEILYAENRKIIDPLANRYFAVLNPQRISLKAEIKEARALLHPDFPERGYRIIPVNSEKIYVEKEDFENFREKEVGLIYLATVKLRKRAELTSEKVKIDIQKIQWVSEPNVKIRIMMPNGEIKKGIAEPNLKNCKEGEIVQLVRIGFARIDKIDDEITLYFAHK